MQNAWKQKLLLELVKKTLTGGKMTGRSAGGNAIHLIIFSNPFEKSHFLSLNKDILQLIYKFFP